MNVHSLSYMSSGMGQLTNLQTLNDFVLELNTKRHNGQFSSGLKELMELNNLRGELSIRNLRHGEDASVEYKDAKLNGKQHLNHLQFVWSNTSSDDVVDETEATDYEIRLESLQPHPDLEAGLSSNSYRSVRLPNWLPYLTRLGTLCLGRCKKFQNLLPVTHLHCLKSL